MGANTFGHILQLTSFGESHGNAIGGVITGFPAGISISLDFIQEELNKRRPGQSNVTTPRNEPDQVEILSGVMDDVTLGTPIGFLVKNINQQSSDYNHLKSVFRPSHADYTYTVKYGIRDHRGGGRSSARETISRVVMGAFSKFILRQFNIRCYAWVSQVGKTIMKDMPSQNDLETIYSNALRCPNNSIADLMQKEIESARKDGDTLGGIISGLIMGLPPGIGQPVFNKLQADLGAAMLGINAVKGFEYGDGFSIVSKRGSEVMDTFIRNQTTNQIHTSSNHSGGIQGGISNGEQISFRVAFKPIATLQRSLPTMTEEGKVQILHPGGRHDTCVLPRAAIIVESMAAWVIADHVLWSGLDTIEKIKKTNL
ncbi:MAG: chorismate synthase [Flavobacteriales bacterium]|nr:chorismate synthase [Flavobacteriales bacterium]